jgi:hypothetical protein
MQNNNKEPAITTDLASSSNKTRKQFIISTVPSKMQYYSETDCTVTETTLTAL